MSDISKNLEKAKLELSQAQEDFKAAELLAESGFYSGASNRLYYSLFHGLCSIFAKDGIRTRTHRGCHNIFMKEYTMKGVFPEEDAKVYSQLQTLRELGDYDTFYSVKEKDVKAQIPVVKDFLERASRYRGMYDIVIDAVINRAKDPSAKLFSKEQYEFLEKFKSSAGPESFPDLWDAVVTEMEARSLRINPKWVEDTHQELMDFADGKVRDQSLGWHR